MSLNFSILFGKVYQKFDKYPPESSADSIYYSSDMLQLVAKLIVN